MLIPCGTDAPIYHLPFGTVGLIVVNSAVFAFCVCLSPSYCAPLMLVGTEGGIWTEAVSLLILDYGTINPIQWLTSAFMHGDIVHLIGNMIFLWTFGIVVEGKVGWKRFLAIYLAVAVIQSGVEQCMMFSISFVVPSLADGGSLGASSAIFGLLAICAIWAPSNNFSILFIWLPLVREFEASIATVAFFYIASEVYDVYMSLCVYGMPGAVGSAFLHLMGVVPGALIGFWLLQARLVDCEGWDAISVWNSQQGREVLTVEQEQEREQAKREERAARDRSLSTGHRQVREYIDAGNYDMALNRFRLLRRGYPGVPWNRKNLGRLIQGLHSEGRWEDSIPLMELYVENFLENNTLVRLKLAEILLVKRNQPTYALRVLDGIQEPLEGNQKRKRELLQQKAEAAERDELSWIKLDG